MRLNLIHSTDNRSLPYVFISEILKADYISEDIKSNINNSILDSLNHLRNFLKPDLTTDLESLLMFIAPNNGGLNSIKQLLQTAKNYNKPIIDDNGWWLNLFHVCNIKDNHIQNQIKSAVVAEFNKEKGVQTQQNVNKPSSSIQQPQVQGKRQEIPQQPIEQLVQFDRGGNVSEDILKSIVDKIINENMIGSNLKFVANNVLRHFGILGAKYSEDDWLSKFMYNVKKPVYETYENYNYSSINERLTKIAIKMIFNHLKRELSEKLKLAGLTITDLKKIIADWDVLCAKHKQNPQNQALNQYIVNFYERKLKPLLAALNPTIRNDKIDESSQKAVQALKLIYR